MTFFRKLLTWKLIFVPIAFFAIVFISGAIKHTVEQIRWSKEVGNKTIFHPELARCGNEQTFFNVSPIKEGEYSRIVPLGAFGSTGGHIFPTKHIYFMSTAAKVEDQTDVTVYSPGDLYITYFEQAINKTLGYTDYFVYTSPCRDVEVDFYHLNTVNAKITAAFDATSKKNCRTEQNGSVTNESCGAVIKDVKLEAGEELGIANPAKKKGILQFFDMEMSDHRTPELVFANPDRWTGGFDFKHIVCPLDYFSPELKDLYYSQIADYNDPSLKRTIKPLCGEYDQDIAGTAQGAWFKKSINSKGGDSQNENSNLSLAHHNVLAQKGVIVVGVSTTETIEAGAYPFDPVPTGLVNRDFKDITADNQTYCFEPTGLTGIYRYPFRVLLQMSSSTELKLEGQKDQDCSSKPWDLGDNAVTFIR
ncbi:MAG: hypothetical protein NUV85_02530 [Candidatus Berkelbacteria bacterium]|nr:hypothetical protein [Candidatus Berkelbacteria bacterium]